MWFNLQNWNFEFLREIGVSHIQNNGGGGEDLLTLSLKISLRMYSITTS